MFAHSCLSDLQVISSVCVASTAAGVEGARHTGGVGRGGAASPAPFLEALLLSSKHTASGEDLQGG